MLYRLFKGILQWFADTGLNHATSFAQWEKHIELLQGVASCFGSFPASSFEKSAADGYCNCFNSGVKIILLI